MKTHNLHKSPISMRIPAATILRGTIAENSNVSISPQLRRMMLRAERDHVKEVIHIANGARALRWSQTPRSEPIADGMKEFALRTKSEQKNLLGEARHYRELMETDPKTSALPRRM